MSALAAKGASSSSASAPGTHRAQISIVHGEAFVWSADDIAFLRRNHGIVGLLTGSLPLIPQQNSFLGVPLQLFEEEVVYLLRRGAAYIVDDVAAHADVESLDDNERKAWHRARNEHFDASKREAAAAAENKKRMWMDKVNANPKAEERRRARQEQRAQRQKEQRERDPLGEGDDDDGEEAGPTANSANDTEAADGQTDEGVPDIAHPFLIPSTSVALPWHKVRTGVNAFDSLSSAAKARLWTYPATAKQRAHCAVFEALRGKDYYLGKGIRFGGDFVVYPGDPLRYHSHFTATVQTTPQAPITAQELVAAGRLGTAVKKAHLLCAVEHERKGADQDNQKLNSGAFDAIKSSSWGNVDFYSLTWAGFGT